MCILIEVAERISLCMRVRTAASAADIRDGDDDERDADRGRNDREEGHNQENGDGCEGACEAADRNSQSEADCTTASTKPANGRSRVVVEGVTPQIDGGRFAVKRVVGDQVRVEADVFGDGHDLVRAHLLYRHTRETDWRSEEMTALGNDHWAASFAVEQMGFYEYTVVGEVDHFLTWRSELKKRQDAGQDLDLPLKTGALLIEAAAKRATKEEAAQLRAFAEKVRAGSAAAAFDDALLAIMKRNPETEMQTRYERTLRVWVDRERARYSSWYELFPRSWGKPGQHGTLRDVAAQLDYVEEMGFDVLYLPPIHPIGRSFRKGKNNTTEAKPGDVGSPWAIGAKEGGHLAILPELGTFADLDYLIEQLARAQDGARAGYCLPVRSGSSLGQGAPGVVQEARGWFDPICGESAEEISGHLSAGLRIQRLAGAVGCAEGSLHVLGGEARAHLPRG